MEYIVRIQRCQRKGLIVDADSPEAARQKARERIDKGEVEEKHWPKPKRYDVEVLGAEPLIPPDYRPSFMRPAT